MTQRTRSRRDAPVCTWIDGEKLRLHKGSGQGYFIADGKRLWMGRYFVPGTRKPDPATMTRAAAWVQEYRVLGSAPLAPREKAAGRKLTVAELVERFSAFLKTNYAPESSEPHAYAAITGEMVQLYGAVPAEDFGPLKMEAVRDRLVQSGRFNRVTINGLVSRGRRVFKWASSKELLPIGVHEALRAIDGLRRNRTTAREPKKVGPVSDAHVQAALPHLSRQVAAMVRIQRLTGARPGEIVLLRPQDIDRSGEVWVFRPERHKTEHHGIERAIYLGPQAQEILKPFLLCGDAYCFSAAEAEHERRVARSAARTTPTSCGNVPGSNRVRRPLRAPGDRYTTSSYRIAIQRACAKAGIAEWAPNQLRHTAATDLRAKFGIEAARVALGHTDAKITAEVYAEQDRELAKRIAKEVG